MFLIKFIFLSSVREKRPTEHDVILYTYNIIARMLLNVLHAFFHNCPMMWTSQLLSSQKEFPVMQNICKYNFGSLFFFLQKDKENVQLSSEGASQILGRSHKR